MNKKSKQKAKPAKGQAIIFDFDGTMADSMSMFIEIAYELTGHEKIPNERIQYLRTLTLQKLTKELGVSMWRIPTLVARGRRKMEKRKKELKMFRGMPDVIRELAKTNKIFVLSSNNKTTINAVLSSNKLQDSIDEVYGGIGLLNKHLKLKQVIKSQRLVKAQTWYVGDEIRDIQAAKKERLKSIAVCWGYNNKKQLFDKKPTCIVTKPMQITSCIKNYR